MGFRKAKHKKPRIPNINNASQSNGIPKVQNPTAFVLAERNADETLTLVDDIKLQALAPERIALLASAAIGTFYQCMSQLYKQDRQLAIKIEEDDIAHDERRKPKFIEVKERKSRTVKIKPKKRRSKK